MLQCSQSLQALKDKTDTSAKNWPQDLVWTKQDGNIYYSLRGYNQWLTEQTQKRYQPALELGECTRNQLHL